MKRRDHVVEPRLAKPLLALHAAMDVEGFWQASQDLLEAAMPSLFIGCWLQLNPLTPMICLRNRLWMPDKKWFEGYFACNPVSPYLAAHPGARFVGTSHGFKPETDHCRSYPRVNMPATVRPFAPERMPDPHSEAVLAAWEVHRNPPPTFHLAPGATLRTFPGPCPALPL